MQGPAGPDGGSRGGEPRSSGDDAISWKLCFRVASFVVAFCLCAWGKMTPTTPNDANGIQPGGHTAAHVGAVVLGRAPPAVAAEDSRNGRPLGV